MYNVKILNKGDDILKLAVIGGGASGMAAAIEAKTQRSNIQITIFEHLPKVCKKILVTGNGRCNFTNKKISLSDFYGDKDFLNNILSSQYSDCEAFFENMGILSYCESGRVYPRSQQSSAIRDALLNKVLELGVEIITETEISLIKKTASKFLIADKFYDAVIVAGGGRASPVQGSDGSCYKLLTNFGHKLNKPYPALCGITSNDKFLASLKGVRVEANASLYDGKTLLKKESGEIQFTEKAVSGIPVMNLSHLVKDKEKITLQLDLCEDLTKEQLTNHIKRQISISPKKTTEQLLSGIINTKLCYAVTEKSDIKKNTYVSKLNENNIQKITNTLKCFKINISGTRDFNNAQITCGGISVKDFSPENMMSKLTDGLFACGEILDIHGDCGGYNLHLAWLTGRLAGKGAADYLKTVKDIK